MSHLLRKDLGVGEHEEADLGSENTTRIRIFRLLILVAQEMRTRMDEILRPDGLTTQQAALITVVEALGSPSLTQAAASLGTTHQNLKQVAAALARKGFLRIVRDAEDGRVRRLVTTARSREYWQQRSAADHERVVEWFAGFSEDEVRTLFELLWKLEEKLRGEGERGTHQESRS
jgi:DNA-binding MarR family transcriptional regulator